MKKELLIIIPAYNEEKTIGKLLDALQKPPVSEMADILVMNDASVDGTEREVKKRQVPVVTHIYNLGYGNGLQLGYKYALNHGYRYVIQMDADGQHDPSNIPAIYEKLTTKDADGHCPDIVLGSRFIKGAPKYPAGVLKRMAWAVFRFFIRLGTGRRITDPTTGLQGLGRKAFSYYAGYRHFDDRYPDANMILQMLLLGFRIEEVPALMHVRTTGKSMHSGLKPVTYMFRMTFSMLAVFIRIKWLRLDLEAIKDETV